MNIVNYVKKKLPNYWSLAHPMYASSFSNWIQLLRASGGIDVKYLPKVFLISLLSPLSAPLRLLEHLKFGRAIANLEIEEPPVFIIGHWRSGTTHLHNIMSQDPNFGYVTTFQTMVPEFFLVGDKILKPYLRKLTPKTRLMDNMAMAVDSPHEEEAAIGTISPYCFYYYWYFPRKMKYYFRTSVLFEGVSEAERCESRC